ncbi:hypothetical protein ACQXVK_05225 [Curtobacterium sp. AB451]|uniref:hypothetical protein n=1 Tax=Curtobacterium sp. AB451 TaxID=3422306 RepID=UPI003D353D09
MLRIPVLTVAALVAAAAVTVTGPAITAQAAEPHASAAVSSERATHAFAVTSPERYVPDTRPVITGTGTPGSDVLVMLPGKPVTFSTTVAADGRWSATSPEVFSSGDYFGNLAYQQQDGQLVQFDLRRGAAPAHTAPTTLRSDGPTRFARGAKPTFAGTGTPGARVVVAIPGLSVEVAAVVRADGHWSAASPSALPASGQFLTTVTQDGDGQYVEFWLAVA